MITYATLERFAKSPVKITILLSVVIVALGYNNIRLESKINLNNAQAKTDLNAEKKEHREDVKKLSDALNGCRDKSQAEADKAVINAVKEAEDYRKLYLKMLELKMETQNSK